MIKITNIVALLLLALAPPASRLAGLFLGPSPR
jgi:hypothetical protein